MNYYEAVRELGVRFTGTRMERCEAAMAEWKRQHVAARLRGDEGRERILSAVREAIKNSTRKMCAYPECTVVINPSGTYCGMHQRFLRYYARKLG